MAPRPAKISPEAARCLKKEIAYLAERSPQAAARVASNIRDARERLLDFPRIARRGVTPGMGRAFVKPEYILTARIRDGVAELAAIRSAKRGDAHAPSDLLNGDADPGAEDGSS